MRYMVAGWLIVGLFLAGCIADPSEKGDEETVAKPAIPVDWAERAVEAPSGHDHRDPGQHMGRSTPNFKVIGHNPLISRATEGPASGFLCGDVAEKDGRRLAVVHSWVVENDVAFMIADLTEPTDPKVLGEFILERSRPYDLGITPDQRFVMLATDAAGGTDELSGLPLGPLALDVPTLKFRDACTGETTVLAGPETLPPYWEGVVLVDIQDPTAPAFADYLPLGGGHSIQIRDLGGRTLALVTTATFSLIELVEGGPDGPRLQPVSMMVDCGGTAKACSYHDGFLQKHPVTGENLAYLANGCTYACLNTKGLAILNIDDPEMPRLVGTWSDWSKTGGRELGYPHGALALDELWDGRHYTILGDECGLPPGDLPSCMIIVLDTTDPADPQFVSAWTIPVRAPFDSFLLYSMHYVAVSNGTMFVTNYHGGLWAVDISTPEARAIMPTVGVFMPENHLEPPYESAYGWSPSVLDVNVLSDGSLIVWDYHSGLHVVRFDAADPAPAPPPWPFG